jgi:hypothetical protein
MCRFNSVRVSGEAISFSFAAVLFLAVIHLEALAQDKRPAPVASQKQKTGSLSTVLTYSSSELNRAAHQLPAQFKGNDIALVSRKLLARQRQAEKSEFETTEQWQYRLATLRSNPIVGKMTGESTWTFPLLTVLPMYDADKQVLDIYVPLYDNDLHDRTDFRRVMESREESDSRHHMASNAFGVRVRVLDSFSTSYSIAANNWSAFALEKDRRPTEEGGGLDSIHTAIPSEPNKARRIKDGLAAVALCRLVEPFCIATYDSTKATISIPVASRSQFYYLTVDLVELWIYDRASGIVLSKIRPRN